MDGRIAVNTKHTGDPRRDNRGYAEPMNREQVDSLLAEGWLRQMVAGIRTGNERLKEQLPFLCPHYSQFRNNHRAQADIIPEAFTYMTCVDVDDAALVQQAIGRAMEMNADEYSEWQDHVLRIEYSARKKVHIYVRLLRGKTIEESQRLFCEEMGVPYDESCTTPERFIYLTGRDEEVFRSPHWMEPLSEEELAERREAYLERGLDVDGRPLRREERSGRSDARAREEMPCGRVQADERMRYIFDACMRECQLEPEALVVPGGRHDAVKSLLSVGATQLLSQEEFMAVLAERMPAHWQDENIRQLVADFYAKYHDPCQRMTQFQRKVFAQSRRISLQPAAQGAVGTVKADLGATSDTESAHSPSLELPERLPQLIGLLTSRTPDIYKAAVAHAVFPPLATHLCGVTFRYTDNTEHEATLMNCLMAPSGAGKSCIDMPIERIMADIKLRDKENEQREAEWKKDCTRKGANKDKQPRPEGLVIQIIDPDMTKPALVTRMDEAEGHFVYVKLNELDLFEQLKGQTGKQHFQLMCLAFDPGAEYGQTRVGTQSVTARPRCRFNWNASTTIAKGRRFFRNVLTDGPISRINFCTIPKQEIGCKQPVYGTYDAEFDEQLRPYIENLVNARGLVDCPQALRLSEQLQQETSDFAQLSQSDAYWDLSHRANVIAYLKACVLYVANGQKWEPEIEDFVRWSLNYDLWCKMQFFGDDIDRATNDSDARIGTRGPRNLLELLPEDFTLDDAKRVRFEQGLSNEGRKCIRMIRTWMNRGYVIQNTEYSFKKKQQER